mmetsp:Transcript_31055/g.69985  ORF Transcript_31055/g.69985 Transcript_31055/m.69985 type:complete len:269 (-) Transcript_31055:73-879(-)
MVARIANLRPSKAVDAHQRRSFGPVEAHTIQEGLLHGIASIFGVRQAARSEVTGEGCRAAEAEGRAEVERRGTRIGSLVTRAGRHDHSLCRDDEEVGQRHGSAELLVHLQERYALVPCGQATWEAGVVWIRHVRTGISSSLAVREVHEVMASHPKNASGPICLWAVCGRAHGRERLQASSHSLNHSVVLGCRHALRGQDRTTRTWHQLRRRGVDPRTHQLTAPAGLLQQPGPICLSLAVLALSAHPGEDGKQNEDGRNHQTCNASPKR